MAKVVCVLYDDPVTGYPKSYARDDVPKHERIIMMQATQHRLDDHANAFTDRLTFRL